MRNLKFIAIIFISLVLTSQVNAKTNKNETKKTAESVFANAKEMKSFDAKVFKSEFKQLSNIEKTKLINLAIEDAKDGGCNNIGMYILAVIFPPLAVGIHTGWELTPTLSNVCWTILGGLPGMIHAFIVLGR